MLAATLAVLVPNARPAHPAVWLTTGHSIVCEIAWLELGAEARRAIGALIERDPGFDEFAPSCDWPDLVRSIAEYGRYASAHYVNVAEGAGGVDVARDCGPGLCAVDAIEVFAGRLRDPDTSVEARLVALKYLGHVVGDLHQPLHAGRAADRGGGAVDVCLPGGGTPNLHWVWDEHLVRARLEATGLSWREFAAALHRQVTAVERRLWASLDPRDWANESWALVQDEVYGGLDADGCLVPEYGALHAYTIDRRLRQAGVRLGGLLNEIFG
ncbi:MAG: S1/P1 nuclease [Acidobacteriota bacterium]|nr:S1/P1 nuclease [Acidobacteriota bacterium]